MNDFIPGVLVGAIVIGLIWLTSDTRVKNVEVRAVIETKKLCPKGYDRLSVIGDTNSNHYATKIWCTSGTIHLVTHY